MLEQIGKNARQAALALNALGSPQKNLGLNAAADALLHDTGRLPMKKTFMQPGKRRCIPALWTV